MTARIERNGFTDRADAGRRLAARLDPYAGRSDVVVLALPRGGVPVAAEVAEHLDAPLDVLLVRKLGVPGREEHALGAIASGGVVEIDTELVRVLGVGRDALHATLERERAELLRRERAYRGDRPPAEVHEKIVILVDDGLATGATMHAAVTALRKFDPGRIVVAVPVAATEAREALLRHADDCVALTTPEPFVAVGLWYQDFEPTTDAEVLACLAGAAERVARRARRAADSAPRRARP